MDMTQIQTQRARLKFPAPSRMSLELSEGRYCLVPWTKEGVESALEAGIWFVKGRHVFANRAAAKAAGLEE